MSWTEKRQLPPLQAIFFSKVFLTCPQVDKLEALIGCSKQLTAVHRLFAVPVSPLFPCFLERD